MPAISSKFLSAISPQSPRTDELFRSAVERFEASFPRLSVLAPRSVICLLIPAYAFIRSFSISLENFSKSFRDLVIGPNNASISFCLARWSFSAETCTLPSLSSASFKNSSEFFLPKSVTRFSISALTLISEVTIASSFAFILSSFLITSPLNFCLASNQPMTAPRAKPMAT